MDKMNSQLNLTTEESKTPSSAQFSQSLENIIVDVFCRLSQASDDAVVRTSIFRDALAFVFATLLRIVAEQRGLIGDTTTPKTQAFSPQEQQIVEEVGTLDGLLTMLSTPKHSVLTMTRITPQLQNDLHTNLTVKVMPLLGNSSVPVEYLGNVFELLYGRIPNPSNHNKVELENSTARRDKGVYYTPPELAEYVTQQTLLPYIEAAKDVDDILKLRIVDPAMGTGIFLLNSLRLLSRRAVELATGSSLSIVAAGCLVAKHCLYGVDIDLLAVEITRVLICLEIGGGNLPVDAICAHVRTGDALLGLSSEQLSNNLEGASIMATDDADWARNPDLVRQAEDYHLQVIAGQSKFLSEELNTRKLQFTPFCWELAFPNVFLDSTGKRQPTTGFDILLSNPPWGKLKPDVKEFLAQLDANLTDLSSLELRSSVLIDDAEASSQLAQAWLNYTAQLKGYSSLLKKTGVYKHQVASVEGKSTGGDADLYKLFMERSFKLVKCNGRMGFVLPAAFHGAQGATGIRNLYLTNGTFEQLFEFENRKNIFPIHSMFKFVTAIYQRSTTYGIKKASFGLVDVEQARAISNYNVQPHLSVSTEFLHRVSGSLMTIPTVRTNAERLLFDKLHCYPTLGTKLDNTWNVTFNRELDMTNDSKAFLDRETLLKMQCEQQEHGCWVSPIGERYLPLYEGRMVHQFDCAAKAYKGGHARKAEWNPCAFDDKMIVPHYFIAESYCSKQRLSPVRPRVGFCDITGHANERTVLAALIPPNTVCGNKVPTCSFDTNDLRLHLIWCAIANSFVIDWIVRRRISTTLNFFHWMQIPFPRIEVNSALGIELVNLALKLSWNPKLGNRIEAFLNKASVDTSMLYVPSLREQANIRAEIDAIVACLFKLTIQEYALVIADFPRMDRRQPSISLAHRGILNTNNCTENISTVTRDLALLTFCKRTGIKVPDDINQLPLAHTAYETDLQTRVSLASESEAIAYVPSEAVQRECTHL